jgi:acyl-CoA synthetase (AMP-forming)/AMP-acid ligase II
MSGPEGTGAVNLAGVYASHLGQSKVAYIDLTVQPPVEVTYDEFDGRCRAAAGLVRRLGAGVGDRVAILADNSVDYAALYFGICRLGAVTVPLNTKLAGDVLAYIVADAGVRLVFADERHASRAPEGTRVVVIGGAEWNVAATDIPSGTGPGGTVPDGMVLVDPAHVAVQMYTSGSTGRPKGVLLSHGSQLFTVEQYTSGGFFMSPDERIMVSAPMYHKNAMVQTKVNLALGGQIVLQARFQAAEYLRAVAEHLVTSLTGVPTMFALMTEQRELLDALDLSPVRRLMIGSAPMTEGLFDQVQALFPRAAITNGYGTTECIACFGPHPEGRTRPKIALGYPLSTVEVRLVDPATGQDANPGEFWIRGRGVMNGYHGLPQVTAERLTDGWYHTGDVMERDEDGWYFFVGRVDDMFVCGGENVYPGDVEQLLERHAEVHQAAVVAVPDSLKGALPVAFVVREAGSTLTEEELRQWSIEHGPAYAHPRAVWFVDEIPLGGTAKIDKQALAAEAAQRFTR